MCAKKKSKWFPCCHQTIRGYFLSRLTQFTADVTRLCLTGSSEQQLPNQQFPFFLSEPEKEITKRNQVGSNLILCPPEMRRQCRGCRGRTGKEMFLKRKMKEEGQWKFKCQGERVVSVREMCKDACVKSWWKITGYKKRAHAGGAAPGNFLSGSSKRCLWLCVSWCK